MGLNELQAWFGELAKVANPIRREFHLFTLLSGSRPDALSKARVQDINFKRRTLHLPSPKGGSKRAFDIPLSRPMVRCLVRAIRAGRVAIRFRRGSGYSLRQAPAGT
jgi:integrase